MPVFCNGDAPIEFACILVPMQEKDKYLPAFPPDDIRGQPPTLSYAIEPRLEAGRSQSGGNIADSDGDMGNLSLLKSTSSIRNECQSLMTTVRAPNLVGMYSSEAVNNVQR